MPNKFKNINKEPSGVPDGEPVRVPVRGSDGGLDSGSNGPRQATNDWRKHSATTPTPLFVAVILDLQRPIKEICLLTFWFGSVI